MHLGIVGSLKEGISVKYNLCFFFLLFSPGFLRNFHSSV